VKVGKLYQLVVANSRYTKSYENFVKYDLAIEEKVLGNISKLAQNEKEKDREI